MIEKLYRDVDMTRWNRIVKAAYDGGVHLYGWTGEGSTLGVKLEWAFDPTAKELKIKIVESQWFPISQAESFIDTMIQTA